MLILGKSQINNLRCHLNILENEEKNKVKVRRKNDIIEVRTEGKKLKTRKKYKVN